MLVASALFCHAPVVIPAIAAQRFESVRNTCESMQAVSAWLLDSNPDRILVLSPHTPRLSDSFSVSAGQQVAGDFAEFGHAELSLRFPADTTFGGAMCAAALEPPLSVLPVTHQGLDHGAGVPLYFLAEAGWHGPVLVVGYPDSPTHSQCRELGKLLAEVCWGVGGKTAICASGDMSHCLSKDSPCGFHPAGECFDDFLVEKIRRGDIQGAVQVEEGMRESAAEDVVDSLEIASAAVDFSSNGHQFFSYERPFGVGYLVAALHRNAGV